VSAAIDAALGDGDEEFRDTGSRSRARPRPSIHEGPPSVLYTVKQVELAVRHHLDELLKPAGITALQYTALTVLERRDGLTLTELAHNSFVKVQSMADLLRPLYRHELICRRADPAHGRRQLVSLTPAGRALLSEYEDRAGCLEQEMLSPLSDDEVESLRSMLARCRTALA
jgi:DNA-binding MarR family transcriptional regulator